MNHLDPGSDLASEASLWTFGIDDDEQTSKKTQRQKAPKSGQKLAAGTHIAKPSEAADRGAVGMIHADKKTLGTTKNGKPCYSHDEPRSRTTVVCVPPKGKEIDDLAEYNARILSGMDDLTADVLFIMTAHWRQFQDAEGYVTITASDILNERGIAPYKKDISGKEYLVGHRPEDIEDVNERIQQLRGLKLIISTTSLFNGRKRKAINRGYLLVVSQDWVREEGAERAYAWKCKFYEGLEALVRNERFCNVYRKALSYNHLKHSPEKRLSFLAAEGFRLNRNRAFTRSMDLVIKTLNLPFHDDRPGRSVDRIVAALNRLQADGGLASDPHGWGIKLSPGVYTQRIEDLFKAKLLPARNFGKAFRQLNLRLFPPSTLPEIKDKKKRIHSEK